jgi:hypothetical protein
MKRVTFEGKKLIVVANPNRVPPCPHCVFEHDPEARCARANDALGVKCSRYSDNPIFFIEDTPEGIAKWAAARMEQGNG